MSAAPASLRGRTYWALSDAWVVTKYNLIAVPRVPELLVFLTIQPIIFVVLFRSHEDRHNAPPRWRAPSM